MTNRTKIMLVVIGFMFASVLLFGGSDGDFDF